MARSPEDFPAFGEPVFAPVSGRVVRTYDRERDHLSRNSWPAYAYLLVECIVRELTGPRRILGNHVVIEHRAPDGEAIYAAVAHLRRGSVAVRPGQRVQGGQPIAACGNSGNSSEPHVHLQVMDRPGVLLAAGLPMAFEATAWGQPGDGLPAKDQAVDVTVANGPQG